MWSFRGRCEGGRVAFRAAVFGAFLLLGLSRGQSVPPETSCPAAASPESLSQPPYRDSGDEDGGFMSDVVRSFLHTVQPRPFPQDLILKIVQDFEQVQSNQEIIKEALLYEVGFLVCAALGLLYIVLMPVVGLLLACCRCCGNCGGKMYQKQTSSIHCRRRTLYWTTLITTAIILAGNICMFISNESVKDNVDQSQAELSRTLDNMHSFLNTVPQQLHHVVNESYRTVQQVATNLDAVGPQLGSQVQQCVSRTLHLSLRSVRQLDEESVNTAHQLTRLNSSLDALQSNMDRLHGNVTAVRNRISQTMSDPNCINCERLRPELHTLSLDASVTIPSLNEFQSAVDEIIRADLKSKIKEAEDYFDSIPQRITNDTQDVVQNSQQLLAEIKSQISRVTDDLPLSVLTNVSESLQQLQTEISRVSPQVQRAEHIRWTVCVTLSCVVLLVVVCNVLGLILAPLGLSPKSDPTERSCTADCGGTFLMMAAGFSFLFSWLFMIIVLLLFLLGGNVYTLLCRPWSNGQLLQLVDTPGLIPALEFGPSLGLKTNINISDIYRDCEQNQPLWSTLHLYEIINLQDLLNVSKYTEQIQQHFEDTDITLSSVTLLSPELQNQLRTFSSKASDLDCSAATEQINNISSINLNRTADKLDDVAAAQPNSETRQQLQVEARELRQIQIHIETSLLPQLENLNSSIRSLGSTTQQINGTVGEVLRTVGAAQDFLNTNTSQIVKTESRKFLDCQMSYFIVFADWANITITQQVGRCGPVAAAVDSVQIIVCSNIVESLNAFWFSLGWCLVFFIPSVIFSIKLAKYYRRMKYSDVYDDHFMMSRIPRAHAKIT